MAIKQIAVSDVSGVEMADGRAARVVVAEHPSIDHAVLLDVEVDELARFQTAKIELVHMVVYEPDGGRRQVVMEAKNFAAIFPAGTDVGEVLRNARPSTEPAANGRGAPRARVSRAKAERVDYTAPEKFGQLHRGRVTDEEAAAVRANRERANRNREAQTGRGIDWNDAKEKKRYGLD